ncbi:MAG: sensor histidine kinase, partial [Bacteroidetes bacterium]
PVDLPALVEDILISLKHLPRAKDLDIQTDIPFTEAVVTDRNLLTSILQNLILNSINYHRPEGDSRWVRVRAKQQDGQLSIEVADNGQGIAPHVQERVFEMFFRGDKTSKGSGLGLYIVKKSLEKLGGRIDLDSTPGEGTCFTLTLPLEPSLSPESREVAGYHGS